MSNDCDESEVYEHFWPFVEQRLTHERLRQWEDGPSATTASEIELAEAALWAAFPKDYRVFLLMWNGFNIPPEGRRRVKDILLFCCSDIAAGPGPGHNEYPPMPDIVRMNSACCRWPEEPGDLINFGVDMFSNAYAFRRLGHNRYDVVYWDHDGCDIRPLCESFSVWLNSLTSHRDS